MAVRTTYACRRCDYRTGKWLGRCPECAAWDAFEERTPGDDGRTRRTPEGSIVEPRPIGDVETADLRRTSTGIPELDRVLGGGLVPGGVVLVGGEPGIGKSTLLLQTAGAVASEDRRVLYISGEESASQLRSRADRLHVHTPHLLVATATEVDALVDSARRESPTLVVVDSIQAVRCADLASVPGSVGQVRESASRFVDFAKATGTSILLVGHVTKDGALAGPRTLEHVVDTVVQLEGDRFHEHRILRALKNRFGPSDELGLFRMTEQGLHAVDDPSKLLLDGRPENAPGSVVLAAVEGTRPLMVEIQALVGEPVQGSPRRTTLGVDPNRVALVLAVLQRRTALELADRDVFVNVTGGLTLAEPASDLAVAAAVGSSALRRPVPGGSVLAGEIGLAGEVRSIGRRDARLRESSRLGFRLAVVPNGSESSPAPEGLTVHSVRRVDEAFRLLFD